MTCKVRGCTNTVLGELQESGLCLDHFLKEVQERAHNFDRQLVDPSPEEAPRAAAMQFALLTAAKIASIGIHHPPEEQLARGRLLNAMLLLVDLRDRLETGRQQ
jgi:hypothetical protein